MQNDYLDTEIVFQDEDKPLFVGESRTGRITFRPKVDLYVDSLGANFFLDARGSSRPYKTTVSKKTFIRNKKIIAGEKYQFDIEIKGESPVSYLGKNIELKWKFETDLDLRTDSYLMVRNSYLKKYGLTYNSSTKHILNETKEIQVSKLEQSIRVENVSRELETSNIWTWAIFFILSAGSIFLCTYLQVVNSIFVWLVFEALLFLLLIVPSWYKLNILDAIKVNTTFLGNNQFAVILELSKNVKNIKKVGVNYFIVEEVTDDRGTSVVIRKHKFVKSPTIEKHQLSQGSDKILDYPELAYDFIFDFPEQIIPTSMLGNLKFHWQINITVYFPFGLKSTFVKKIDL